MFLYDLLNLTGLMKYSPKPKPSWEGPSKKTGIYTKKYASRKWRKKAHLAHQRQYFSKRNS